MKKKKQNRFSSLYKEGGDRQEWISNKIKTLIGEGRSREQAIAIALNMADERYQNGGESTKNVQLNLDDPNLEDYYKATIVAKNRDRVPTYTIDGKEYEVARIGSLRELGTLTPTQFGAVAKDSPFAKLDDFSRATTEVGTNKNKPERDKASLFELNRGWILDKEGNRIKKVDIPDVEYFYQNGGQTDYYFGNINPDIYRQPNTYFTPNQVNTSNGQTQPFSTSPELNTTTFDNQNFQFPSTTFPENINFNQGEQYLGLGKNPSYTNPLPQNNTEQPILKLPNQNDFQFFNPYGGVDLEASTQYLGQSIGSGDTLGIVAGGLKTLTGAARNIFGGIGAANRKEEAMKNYYENQREAIVGKPQYQEGGQQEMNPEQLIVQISQAMQEGATPEQIMQQLIQMGLSEQEASQLVQMVLEQNQKPMMKNGGQYLEALKGKRIKDYKLNTETGNYDVTYE